MSSLSSEQFDLFDDQGSSTKQPSTAPSRCTARTILYLVIFFCFIGMGLYWALPYFCKGDDFNTVLSGQFSPLISEKKSVDQGGVELDVLPSEIDHEKIETIKFKNLTTFSPPKFLYTNVLSNSERTLTGTFIRREVEAEEVYSIIMDDNAAQFITGPSAIRFEKGVKKVEYTFTFQSKNLASGQHKFYIGFYPETRDGIPYDRPDSSSSLVSFRIGSSLALQVTMTNEEMLDYELGTVRAHPAEYSEPINVSAELKNTGNVIFKPTAAHITIKDLEGKSIYATTLEKTEDGDFDFVATDAVVDYKFEVKPDSSLNPAKYMLDFELMYGATSLGKKNDIAFQVFPTGTLQQALIIHDFSASKTEYAQSEKVKLTLRSQNAGAVPLKAKLELEITNEQNELIDVVESDTETADPNQELLLSVYTSFVDTGKYTVSGKVKYGNKSDILTPVTVTVVGAGALYDSVSGVSPISLFIVFIFIVTIVTVVIAIRRRRRKRDVDHLILG